MKPRKSLRRSIAFPATILAGTFAAMLAPSAQAAGRTWSGATNTWNTNTNWVGDVLPATNDSLVFGEAGAGGLLLNNDHASFNVAGITFNADAPAYVIGDGTTDPNVGNSFVLTGGVTNNSSKLQTLNTPFSISANGNFSTNRGDISLAGNISVNGTNGILKGGPGTLILSGTNTYSGTTTLGAGTLLLNSAGALPATSALAINGTNNYSSVIGLGGGISPAAWRLARATPPSAVTAAGRPTMTTAW